MTIALNKQFLVFCFHIFVFLLTQSVIILVVQFLVVCYMTMGEIIYKYRVSQLRLSCLISRLFANGFL
jgi:hypothetical protein